MLDDGEIWLSEEEFALDSDEEVEMLDEIDRKEENQEPVWLDENWLLKYLPYYDEIKKNADETLRRIKIGLARTILLRNYGHEFFHWLSRFREYLHLYRIRLTKVDYITFVKLFYSIVTTDEQDLCVLRNVAILLMYLLKRDVVSPDDVVLDWRKLYDIYSDSVWEKYIPDDGRGKLFVRIITKCRPFFSKEATREILDQIRPLIDFNDMTSSNAFIRFELFLPIRLDCDAHNLYGAKLWFDELWYWFSQTDSKSFNAHNRIAVILSNLAEECPGFVKWSTDMYDIILTRVLRSFSLTLGQNETKVCFKGATLILNSKSGAKWITYMLGGPDNGIQPHLSALLRTLEIHMHSRRNVKSIMNFFLNLASAVCTRVKRERVTIRKAYRPKVPTFMQLTNAQLDTFVESLLPCVKVALFSTAESLVHAEILRFLSQLSPCTIVPVILDVTYTALESVVHPHLSIRCLNALGCVSGVFAGINSFESRRKLWIAVEDKFGQPYRSHIISLLDSMVPLLDDDDISRAVFGSAIVRLFLYLVPIVDCSEFVHSKNKLNHEEREFCSASACFEGIVQSVVQNTLNLMSRTFRQGTLSSEGVESSCFTTAELLRSRSKGEEHVHDTVYSIFESIFANCNSSIRLMTFDALFDFVERSIFECHADVAAVADLLAVSIKYSDTTTYKKFLDFFIHKLAASLTDACTDKGMNSVTLWHVTLSAKLFTVRGSYLLQFESDIRNLLHLILPLTARAASEICKNAVYDLLNSLTNIYLHRTVREDVDSAAEQFIPLENWTRAVKWDAFKVDFHVPTPSEIAFTNLLIEDILITELDKLDDIEMLSKNELLKCLELINSCLRGASALIPALDGEAVVNENFADNTLQDIDCIWKASYAVCMSGFNLRSMILDRMAGVLDYVLRLCEDETKSLLQICFIISAVMFARGNEGCTDRTQKISCQMLKLLGRDIIRGTRGNLELDMAYEILKQHCRRTRIATTFNVSHVKAMKLLLRLSTSAYSVVRKCAQRALISCVYLFPFSYTYILDDILQFLKESSGVSHEELKGALYVLIGSGKLGPVYSHLDWKDVCRVLPALLNVQHSEKPSIINLLENLRVRVEEDLNRPPIKTKVQFDTLEEAKKVLHDCATFMPSDDEMNLAEVNEAERRQKRVKLYFSLCDELVRFCTEQVYLHWRFVDTALSMLSSLMHTDVPYPDEVIKLFTRFLIDDKAGIRRIVMSSITVWLHRIQKKPAMTHFHRNLPSNIGPGSNWPIDFGFRSDNLVFAYDSDKVPKNAADWNNACLFFGDQFGFYTWPRLLEVCAPPSQQKFSNRNADELTSGEHALYNIISSAGFAEKMCKLMVADEPYKSRNVVFCFFWTLFENFNDLMLPFFKREIEILLSSLKDDEQRVASNIVGGLICGSRLWRYEKLDSMWKWLSPHLTSCFDVVASDVIFDYWCTCVRRTFSWVHPVQLHWFSEILFDLASRQTGTIKQVVIRLNLLRCAVQRSGWFGIEHCHRLRDLCEKMLADPYQNVRHCIGLCLYTILVFDVDDVYVDEKLPPKFKPVKIVDFLRHVHLDSLWKAVAEGKHGCDKAVGDKEGQKSVGVEKAHETEILTLKTVLAYVSTQNFSSLSILRPPIFNFLPLLLHFANFSVDEELTECCKAQVLRLSTCLVKHNDVKMVVGGIEELSSSSASWWKPKVLLLKYLQAAVFFNLFAFKSFESSLQNLLCIFIKDERIEVRDVSAETFSGMFQCTFFDVSSSIINEFRSWTESKDIIICHAGVLGLSSIILAFPYSIPSFLPDVLMIICQLNGADELISATMKRSLNEFKRTHQDRWQDHKTHFSEHQLSTLTGLLTSRNYYV